MNVTDSIAAPVPVTLNIFVEPDNDGDGDPDITDPDDDNDDILDAWEIAHSLNPLVNDKSDNPDGDEFDNWSEYIADTDPQDADSGPTIDLGPAPATGEPLVKFPSSLNRNYTVEYRNDLNTGSWRDLQATTAGTGSEMSVSDSSTEVHRFYRLLIELP
ncbi:MAG: hypothetical protein ACI8T1_001674 [Verrucomicrobiales bacterium]